MNTKPASPAQLVRISIDAMGGDAGTDITIPASLSVLRRTEHVAITLVGYEDKILASLKKYGSTPDAFGTRLSIEPATEHVEMDESPAIAFRKKRKSSMRIAISLLKENRVEACVSAGNTGALMAFSKLLVKTIDGVDRPAICTALPNGNGATYALDLGANLECNAENLAQFAVMGSVLASCVGKNERPSVGLLNIGEEDNKGTTELKEANNWLSDHNTKEGLNYVGFVEGGAFYSGEVDVIVCDGYSGNIALKASEGAAKLISRQLKKAFNSNIFSKLCGVMCLPTLKKFRAEIDPRLYNGASLLGLRKIVIKSHGGTDVVGFENAIRVAIEEIEQQVPEKIRDSLIKQLGKTIEKV